MTGPRSKTKSLVASMLVASTVVSSQAQAQMACQALFRENAASKNLEGTLAHIRIQEGYERIYDRMARWEKMGDTLRGWNGRTHAKHVIKRRALLRGIEASLRRGDAGDVMNKIRPVYRGVEVEYGRLLQLDRQIAELESGLAADGNRVDVQVDANVKLAALKLERTKRLSRFGTRYAEYVEIRGYLEKAIETEKMTNSDQYIDSHASGLESVPAPRGADPKKDPLSKEARLQLYIETAKTADSKLSVESLKSWLPEFEPLERRPTLDEIKAYFKTHPEARNAFLRYHAVEELFTFLKFFVNRGAGILKAGTYRLPEQIKGVPVRKPIEDAIGISQDVDLVESYGHLIQEVNRAVVSTHEKYALLLQKAAGAPPEKFYETFARMPLAADVFTELKNYTKQKDPMVHRHMVAAEAVRTKKGDLPEEGYFSVADRAYRYALAFVAGTMVGYMTGIGDDTIDAIWGWLFGMKKEIEGELSKTGGHIVSDGDALGFADLEGMLGPSEEAVKEAPQPAPKKKEKTAAPPASESKPVEKKQELVPVHLPAPAAPAAPAPAEKAEAPKEEVKSAEKPAEKPQAEKPKIPDIKKGKEEGAADGKAEKNGEKNIVPLGEDGKKSPNAHLLRPGKKDQAKESGETTSTTEGEKPAQAQAQPKQPKSEPQGQLEGTAPVAPSAPAPAAPSSVTPNAAPAAGPSILSPAPMSGSEFVPSNLQPTSRSMSAPANQPRRSTTTPGTESRQTTTPQPESRPSTTTPRSLPVARPMNATTEITAPAPAPVQKPAVEFKLAQPPAAKAISESVTEKVEAKGQSKPSTAAEQEKKRVRLGVDPQNKDGFLFKPVRPKSEDK